MGGTLLSLRRRACDCRHALRKLAMINPVNSLTPRLPYVMSYAELHAKSNFSFLEGASHPEELVERAAELGYAALAVTDRNSLAGVVRATWRPRGMV